MSPLKKRDTRRTGDPLQTDNNIVINDDLVAPAPLPGRPITVLCPLHKLPLPLQMNDKKKFAVCECNLPNNKHKGQVVWERNL